MVLNEKGSRLLILGSMDEFVPLVKRARARGIHTVVCDGYPDGPARAFADEAYIVDPRNTEALCDLCRDRDIDAAIASFSDILFESLCTLTHAAGLESYCSLESMACLRKKDLMKDMLHDIGVFTPQSCILPQGFSDDAVSALQFPCVMKPLNGYGSRGVFVVEDVHGVREKYAETLSASSGTADAIVLEEYDCGHEFNMISWVADGLVHLISIADREKSEEVIGEVPHVSRIVYPSRFTAEVRDEALIIVQKIADRIGMVDGPLCLQFFWQPNRGIRVCEAVGRLFGYEHELVTYGSGLSLEDLLLDMLYDKQSMRARVQAHDLEHFTKPSCGLYFHGHEGAIADARQAHEVLDDPAVVESLFYCNQGDTITHGVGQKPYVARAYLQTNSRYELDEVTERVFENFRIFDVSGNNLLYKNHLPEELKAALGRVGNQEMVYDERDVSNGKAHA
ncbi:MAG: ATP-grasp domain-containing protein [Raoultibacter sp.]